MTTPFTGEIQIFGFNFPPSQWALANGATIAIQQNSALYSLLGVAYGGNGTSTFQLPNLANRVAISQGTGAGLTPRTIGEVTGENTVTLTQDTMPRHNHPFIIYSATTRAGTPTAGAGLTTTQGGRMLAPAGTAANTTLLPTAVGPAGGNQPHNNTQPYLALNFSIALHGDFPRFS